MFTYQALKALYFIVIFMEFEGFAIEGVKNLAFSGAYNQPQDQAKTWLSHFGRSQQKRSYGFDLKTQRG